MPNIDQFTLTAIPLQQYFNDTPLGHATGFLWRLHNRLYLVTIWHVFSMRDFFTETNLRKDAGRPNILRALFQVPGRWEKQQWDIRIRDTDDAPMWLVHPSTRIDIAVLPFTQPPRDQVTVGLYPMNELANHSLRVEVGMEVLILGYPFAISPPAFPIWKRGSIASEPELARLTYGYMYVDTASRPGMSGAPVIRRSWTNHMTQPGVLALTDTPLNKFIGVYSGRLPTDHPYEAQIGLVWDASYIDEIIVGNTLDT